MPVNWDNECRQYEFFVERRDYGRQICLAVLLDVPYEPEKHGKQIAVQAMKLVPHGNPFPSSCCLSGYEDPSMILTEYEARDLLTTLLNAGIRPLD